jgi:hypothetical protein
MQSINHLELALIELEYAIADSLDCKTTTSDRLERADMEVLLPKIRMAKLAVQFALDALDSMQSSADRNIPHAA